MMNVLSRIWLAGILMFGILAFCPLVVAQSVSEPAKPDAVKGSQLYDQGDAARGIVACASCHGPGGNSAISAYPNLAAMSHEYLAKQLTDFQIQSGSDNPVRMGADGMPSLMTAMVQSLTPEDIQDIALYLAEQPLTQAATATRADLVEQGREIWRGGLPDRGVPACAACHSANGAGLPALFPRLSGQFPEYLESQLVLFRDHARLDPMMNEIAARLSDAEIQAVSDYAAGLR
jgi:cytochrome c553